MENDDNSNFMKMSNTPMQKRNNCDKVINRQGKKLIELCQTFDLQILNGRHSGDIWGKFTHYNKNKGASTVDMAVVSDNFIEEIQHFFVLPQLEISGHCKIVVHIDNIKKDNSAEEIKYDWIKLPSGYKYSDEDLQKFKMVFKNPEIEQDINVCKQLLEAGLIQPTGNKIQ